MDGYPGVMHGIRSLQKYSPSSEDLWQEGHQADLKA
jgi:hypothetical protein